MIKVHADETLENADWPKRTPDTFADLEVDEDVDDGIEESHESRLSQAAKLIWEGYP